MTDAAIYQNPLIERYASRQMAALFSDANRIGTWRKLWIALAEAEAALGLAITPEQIAAMKAAAEPIDFALAKKFEKDLRHDVMAHVHTYGEACPLAAPVIHLGATSCFVTDNGDLILYREALDHVARGLAAVIAAMADFAQAQRDVACLAYTHLQPAQPTTVGKRATLWIADLVMDLEEIEARRDGLKLRGVKGTTGTQASFLKLFDGDHAKVRELERRVASAMGFSQVYAVTGQTYSRKVDAQLVAALAGLASSAHKIATDIRLLSNFRELSEPFEEHQIGSSAMAYKRNPMRSERVCALARFVAGLAPMMEQTHAVQWMERTLDDSAIRRLTIPQAFLGVDAILSLLHNVAKGLTVHEPVIASRLAVELPFMATENLLMAAVAAGGDRQKLHETIRQHSVAAVGEIKQGRANDLVERLAADKDFAGVDVASFVDAGAFVGRAPEQVDEFLAEIVAPVLDRYDAVESLGEIRV